MVAVPRDLTFAPAAELLRLYRARKASPLEVMQAVLGRIDAVNPQVNAIVTLARDAALWEARRATAALKRNAALPPLFGVPVGIKDVTPTRGLRTTYGSKLFESHVPDEDALVVERLRAAGAIVIGKTNTPEFAFGPNTVNTVFGATRNPWNLDRTAGGSSGGSAAALATGMCPLAEGTDLGGSLRGPASFCGVVGFRTTPGLVPRHPSVLAWDSYSVEGPMARTVADTALMLSVMAGPDDRAPLSYDVDAGEFTRGREGGLRTRLADRLDARPRRPRARLAGGARDRRARGRRLPLARRPDRDRVPRRQRRAGDRPPHPRLPDGRPPRATSSPSTAPCCSPAWSRTPSKACALSPREIAEGELLRSRQWQRVREFLATRDVWLTPTMAVPAFPIEQPHVTEIDGRPVGKSHATLLPDLHGSPSWDCPRSPSRADSRATASRWGCRSSASVAAKQPSCAPPPPSRRRIPGLPRSRQ